MKATSLERSEKNSTTKIWAQSIFQVEGNLSINICTQAYKILIDNEATGTVFMHILCCYIVQNVHYIRTMCAYEEKCKRQQYFETVSLYEKAEWCTKNKR